MNLYAAPEAPAADPVWRAVPAWVKTTLAPVFSGGVFISFALATELVIRIPPVGFSRATAPIYFLCISLLITLGAVAPWWIPIGYVYRNRAFLAGALVSAVPTTSRLVFLVDRMSSPVVTATILIETVGLVLLAAYGSHIAARRLGANNSSKPTPLRGAA